MELYISLTLTYEEDLKFFYHTIYCSKPNNYIPNLSTEEITSFLNLFNQTLAQRSNLKPQSVMSPLDLPYITLIFQTIQGHSLELQRSWSFALLQLYALIITKRSWSSAYHRNISTPIHQDNVSRDGMLSKIEPPC